MLDLDKSTIALAASIAAGCRACTDYHLGALERAGGSAAEKDKAIGAASRGMDDLRDNMLAHARGIEPPRPCCEGEMAALDALLRLGVALAVGDSLQVRRFRAQAETAGATPADFAVVQGLARTVRERAAHYAEEVLAAACDPAASGAPCGCH